MRTFFDQAPKMNRHVSLIKGVVCGIRVEDIEEPLMQKIRWMDKLVDELAKAKRWKRSFGVLKAHRRLILPSMRSTTD